MDITYVPMPKGLVYFAVVLQLAQQREDKACTSSPSRTAESENRVPESESQHNPALSSRETATLRN